MMKRVAGKALHCIFFFCLLAMLASCKNDHYRQHPTAKAGLCLSFDDYCVDEWFTLRELFLKYNARVTFFVTKFDTLTTTQVQKLRILQQDGHEIGFHGARHFLSEHQIKKHSMAISMDRGKGINKELVIKAVGLAKEKKEAFWKETHKTTNT
jgi:peptidoglycan/xylan/chitin deacetylase (PgdA/CDA1 family)